MSKIWQTPWTHNFFFIHLKSNVINFIQEKGKPRWVINLGNWDKAEHMKWFGQKKRAKVAKQVVHFYSGGELCDLTGKPRTAQVTLK